MARWQDTKLGKRTMKTYTKAGSDDARHNYGQKEGKEGGREGRSEGRRKEGGRGSASNQYGRA